jgi:hypothetical protein
MKQTLIVAALLSLAACGQQAVEPPPPPPVVENSAIMDCSAASMGNWDVANKSYAVQARAEGPSCPEAIVTLRLLSPAGATLFEARHPVANVPLSFRASPDQAVLQQELDAFIVNVAQNPTAESLPAWPAGAEKPPHILPQVNRADYEAARTARRPIFCYPDGGESNACLALDPQADQAVLLGSWTPERP